MVTSASKDALTRRAIREQQTTISVRRSTWLLLSQYRGRDEALDDTLRRLLLDARANAQRNRMTRGRQTFERRERV